MKAIFKKELGFYFNTSLGYIVAILFAIIANFLFIKDLFLRGNASFRPFFEILPWLYLFFLPALAMRSFSEEKRLNTIEVLLSLPIAEKDIVLGKFLALIVFWLFSLSLTFTLPLTLFLIGRPYLPEIILGYLGNLLLAVSFLSITMFFSSTTKNQLLAYLYSFLTLFLMIILGSEFLANVLPYSLHQFLSYFSPFYHYQFFLKGVIDLRGIVYFISLTFMMIFWTIINLEKRR